MDSRELRFLADVMDEVMDEVHRARKLFPTNAALMVALMEEVGLAMRVELAKAMLDESDDRVRAEAIQTARGEGE